MKKVQNIGIIDRGELVLNPTKQESEKQFLTSLKDGTMVARTLEKYVPPKTNKQVKTIFGLMIKETIVQANDLGIDVSDFLKYLVTTDIPKGQGLTVDFLHELMYSICPTTDDESRRITLSKMNTEQAARLFESFRNIVAGIGIVIPDPNHEWRHLSEI